MAQLAAGGGWTTTITLMNTGSTAAHARLNFFGNDGNPLALPLAFPEDSSTSGVTASTLDQTLSPGGSTSIRAGAPANPATAAVGWTQLLTDGAITAYSVFAYDFGAGTQEAVAPLETRNPRSFVLWFDNTGGYTTGVAVANLAAGQGYLTATVYDDSDNYLASYTFSLAAQEHTSFMTNAQFPATAGRRGSLQFTTPGGGQIAALGIRASAIGSITSVPPMTR